MNERLDYSFQPWTVNELYGTNIINLEPTKAPYENLWYRDSFEHIPGRSDSRIWMQWRKWFRNIWENTISDGIVTDVQELDWHIYYLLKKDNVVELHAICDAAVNTSWCASVINIDCEEEYNNDSVLISSHPTSECMFDKFVRVAYVKNRYKRIEDVTVLHDVDSNITSLSSSELDSECIWKLVLIEYSWAAWLIWQVRLISTWFQLDNPLIWVWTWWQTVTISVFYDYEETLIYASWNWLRAITEENPCDYENDISFTTIYGNTNTDNPFSADYNEFMTSSVFNYQGQIWYIWYIWDKHAWYVNFWMFWYNWWYFSPLTSYQIDWDYKWWIEYNNLVLLFSRTRVWYLSRSTTKNSITWMPDIAFGKLTSSFWIYWQNSIVEYMWDIAVFTTKKKLYALWIEYYGNNAFGDVLFRPKPVDMWKYIQFELDHIDLKWWDNVYLRQDEDRLSVYITNPYQNDNQKYWWFNPSDTTILHFDSLNKFWYKWIVCWVEMIGNIWNLFYGKWIHINCWDKDWVNDSWDWGWDIKQLLWAKFDLAHMTTKSLNVIKWTMWDKSLFTEDNTRIRLYTNLWWLEYIQEFDRFSGLEYMKNIQWGTIDDDCCVISQIYARNDRDDVLVPVSIDITEKYCEYSEDTKNKPINESTWEDEQLMMEYDVNSNATVLSDSMRVGRYWVWSWNVESEWEYMYIEMLAKNWDKLHTSWIELFYEVSWTWELVNSSNSLWLSL